MTDERLDCLLGLPTHEAISILRDMGVTEVKLIGTQAPKNEQPQGHSRVVAVRDEGKTLVVSRFLTDLQA